MLLGGRVLTMGEERHMHGKGRNKKESYRTGLGLELSNIKVLTSNQYFLALSVVRT